MQKKKKIIIIKLQTFIIVYTILILVIIIALVLCGLLILLPVLPRHKVGHLNAVLQVVLLYGEGPPLHLHYGTAAKVGGEERRVNGGGHQDDPHVRVGVHHVAQHHQQEVAVHVALVDFVDNDVGDTAEAGLQLPQKHAHSAKQDRAVGTRQHRLEPGRRGRNMFNCWVIKKRVTNLLIQIQITEKQIFNRFSICFQYVGI